jgi:hypothetical protein
MKSYSMLPCRSLRFGRDLATREQEKPFTARTKLTMIGSAFVDVDLTQMAGINRKNKCK